MANAKKASVPFIFATILLDAMGIGIIIPPLPDVIRRFGDDPAFVNAWFGYFISTYALVHFLAAPVLGALSDKFGRRPVLLVSLLGAALDYVLMAFAPQLWLLFVGRVISGLTGASMTVASSYMADVSTDESRASNFGLIGAAWGMGFIIGPALGALLANLGPQAPFLGAAAFNLVNFLFGLFVLPESLPKEKRRDLDVARLNPLRSIYGVLKPSPIMAMVWIYFLLFLGGQSHPSIWTLYAQHKFGWTAQEVGWSLSFVGLSIAIAQGGLTRHIVKALGEGKAISCGLALYVVSFVLFAAAGQGWMMYAIMILSALAGAAAMPPLQALIAQRVPAHEQGELQGSLMSLGSLSAILGPVLYTHLFSAFSGEKAALQFPGAPYFAAGIICLCAALIWAWSRRRSDAAGAAPGGGGAGGAPLVEGT